MVKGRNKMALFNEDSILFLDEVHKFDCLYNKFTKDFKNKFKKYNCWIKIGDKFGLSPEEAEKKFRNIRTAYGRHLRRMRSIPSGSGRSAVPKIDANLEWLSTSITHRKTVSNFAVDEEQDEEVEAADNDTAVGLVEEEEDNTTEMSPRYHAIDEGDGVISEDESQEKQSEPHDKDDEEEVNTLQETINDPEEQQPKVNDNGGKKAIAATKSKGKDSRKMNTSSQSSQQRPWGVSKKKPSKQDVDFALLQTAKSVAEASNKFSPRSNAKDGPEDENSLFCRSLVHRMQRLHPQVKAFVRCQIEQIFYQAEFGAQVPKGGPSMFGTHQFQQNQFIPADNPFQATAYSPPTTNFRYGSFLQQTGSSSSTPNSEETYTELGVPTGASNFVGQQYSQ